MEYDITAEEAEELEFVWLYSIDLNSAQHIFRTIRKHTRDNDQDKGLRYWLLVALVVTYMRPFSTNRGKVLNRQSLNKKDVVPPDLEDLHDRLENYRNQQFAHTDVSYYNPGIGNLGTADKPWWTMSLKGQDFEYLDRNLQRIGNLIQTVEGKVKALLDEKLAYRLSRVVRQPAAGAPSPTPPPASPPPTPG